MLRPLIRNGASWSQRATAALPTKHHVSFRGSRATHAINLEPRHIFLNVANGAEGSNGNQTRADAEKFSPKRAENHISDAIEYDNEVELEAEVENEVDNELEQLASGEPGWSHGIAGLPVTYDREETHKKIVEAWKSGDSSELLHNLSIAIRDSGYLASLPPVLAIELMSAVDPTEIIKSYSKAYEHRMEPYTLSMPHFTTDVTAILVRSIRNLFYQWNATSLPFTLPVYKMLLRASSAAGDGALARVVFSLALNEKEIELDTEMYNLFFNAICWEGAHDPIERNTLRVTRRALELRHPDFLGPTRGFHGYRTGSRGLRHEVTNKFNEMAEAGIIPNVETFCSLITSMAREGDLEGVAVVLERAWDIDVKKIMESKSDDIYFENDLLPDSPLYPNARVLFTLAHVYGSNNQVSTTLRLVDYVSRKFSLTIDYDTWNEIANWTFQLSTRRRVNSSKALTQERATGLSEGKLAFSSFEDLYQTMTAEPYNIKPQLKIHDMRIRSFFRRREFSNMLEAMVEAIKACDLGRFTPNVYAKMISAYKTLNKNNQSLYELQRTEPHLLAEIGEARVAFRWIKLFLLAVRGWTDVDKYEYQRVIIPNLLGEFSPMWFSSKGISYSVEGGRVQLGRTRMHEPPKLTSKFVSYETEYLLRNTKSPLKAIVHLQNPPGLPFRELQLEELKAQKRAQLITGGTHKEAEVELPWHIRPDVSNWVWKKDGTWTCSTATETVEVRT